VEVVIDMTRRFSIFTLLLIASVLGLVFSLPALQGSGRDLDYLANLWRFLIRFFPPDLSVLPQAFAGLKETAQIATLATMFAALISLPLALISARGFSHPFFIALGRLTQNGIRSIPSLIWALLAVAVVGANAKAGVFALTIYSVGYLGKFFSDAIESSDLSVMTGLRSIGAKPIQAFQFGLWPQLRPLIWSHILWMFEYNLRAASIIGIVGAGGLGVQLYTYQEFYQWDRFCTVLILIFILVVSLDWLGERIRKKLT